MPRSLPVPHTVVKPVISVTQPRGGEEQTDRFTVTPWHFIPAQK